MSAEARLRAKADATKQSTTMPRDGLLRATGARVRDPLARNDGAVCPTGKSLCAPCLDLPALSSPVRKNILVFRSENQSYIRNRPVPKEGRCATSRNVGRDAVDAEGAVDDGA